MRLRVSWTGAMDAARDERVEVLRPWVAYPLVVFLVAVLYLAGPLSFGPVFNILGASSAVMIALGATRHRPRARLAWWLIAIGELAFVVGGVLAYNDIRFFGHELSFPSVADVFDLAMYPCLMLGLLMLLRSRQRTRDNATLIDALVVAIGVGAVSWVYLMAPYAHDGTLTLHAKLTSLAYPVMDLLLLGVAVRLVMGSSQRGLSSGLLTASLVALLATDTVYGWKLLHGGYETGGLLDAGWIAFYALAATAGLHPSMRLLSEPVPESTARLTRRRLTVLAATSLLAPGLQVVRNLLDQPHEPVITVAAGVLFLLVLARLTDLVRMQELQTETALRQRFEARLAALVRHATDVVSILEADGRVTYMSPSATRLLGRAPEQLMDVHWAELVHPDDLGQVLRFLTQLEQGRSGSAEFRLRHADGSWRDVETLATNLLEDGTVDGIVLNTRDVSERKALERRLAHQAFHDALTGLPNRSLFRDRVEQALTRRRRHGTRLAVVFLDLDDFKTVNDSLGHGAGDALLQEVSARLRACVRESDSAARLGGDEFALLLDDVVGELEAIAVVERVIEALAEPVLLDGREFLTTPSVGIAFDSDGAEAAEELLRNADVAMYLAKQQGKGRYAVFEPAMHAAAVGRLELKADLQQAIQVDALTLAYQPIVDLELDEIVGVEALARWLHPERGPVSPGEFIPLAEQTGLIVPLGRALLHAACRQAAILQATCPREPPILMSVNLSVRQLQAPRIIDDVRAALQETGIPPSSLVLELTESAMMEDVELAIGRLNALRALGVSLAIDDFGTGYSSLNYIRRFPIDVLKIDRSFIQDVAQGAADTQAVTETIIDLTRVLGLKPVAEGIEDAEQLARLRELGCVLGQGYFLYMPQSGAEVAELLRAQGERYAAVPAT